MICPVCNGSGGNTTTGVVCHLCDGKGEFNQALAVQIDLNREADDDKDKEETG